MDTLNDTLSHDVITSDRVEGTTVYNDNGDKLYRRGMFATLPRDDAQQQEGIGVFGVLAVGTLVTLRRLSQPPHRVLLQPLLKQRRKSCRRQVIDLRYLRHRGDVRRNVIAEGMVCGIKHR